MQQFFYWLTTPIRVIFSSPGALFRTPRRLLGLSLPARAAVLVEIFLLICTIAAFVTFFFSGEHRPQYDVWLRPARLAILIGLLVAIPIVVYYTLKFWLEGEVSRFPDIDAAWKRGLAELAAHGIDPLNTPIYLLLGVANDKQAQTLFGASQMSFSVRDVPEGPAALHWAANSDAIFISCTETSCLGLLARRATDAAGFAAVPVLSQGGGGDPIRGTIMAGGSLASLPAVRGTAGNESFAQAVAGPAVADFGRTMDIGSFTKEGRPDPRTAPQPPAKKLLDVLSKDAKVQAERLHYVCHLLRNLRQPVCPINGVLTQLPFHVIQQSDGHGTEALVAAKTDLDVLHEFLQLRCPVTAVVAGMETHAGFRELVRRVGAERAQKQRFGKGHNVGSYPSDESVAAVVKHACGAFEDWVYELFRERDGLKKKGNSQLYELLCLIRSQLEPRIENVLVEAFGHDPDRIATSRARDPLMFSGCYFAATADKSDRQAFTASLFWKMVEQEAEIEWASGALAEDNRYQRLANTMMVLNGLLLLTCAGMLVYRFAFWH